MLLEVVELTRSGEAERHALASFPFEARRFAYRSISSLFIDFRPANNRSLSRVISEDVP